MNPSRPPALITGGGSGIGRASAHALARDGFHVVVADIDSAGAKATADAVGGEAAELDVTDDHAVGALLTDVTQRCGPLAALVNCAGIWRYGKIDDIPTAEARRVLEVNVLGPWLLTRAAAASMADGAAIVNLSSTATTVVPAGVGMYPASKGAVEGLTRSLAVELGPRGIRVNAVAPGMIRTEATEHGYRTGLRQRVAAGLPLGRHGLPDDVADVIAFLVGQGSRYVTGQVIVVDGGLTLVGKPADVSASTADR